MNPPRLILGWDVGGTKSALVVGTPEGQILHRAPCIRTAADGPQAMIGEFLAMARALPPQAARPEAAAVSIGGPMNTLTGEILSPPHLPGWDRIPLRELLERELRLPVVVEHDAAACLEAEVLWGAARGTTHAVYLTMGTGCGSGVMVAGRILRGPAGQSPEVGHVRLADGGPEVFGKSGCVESFCGGAGIGRLARLRFPEQFAAGATAREIAARASTGEAAAEAVLAESARRTGQLCALLADLFAPQIILLGSLARHLGPRWVAQIRGEFGREALPDRVAGTRLDSAALGDRLQDLSALAPAVWERGVRWSDGGEIRP